MHHKICSVFCFVLLSKEGRVLETTITTWRGLSSSLSQLFDTDILACRRAIIGVGIVWLNRFKTEITF